MTIEFDDGIVPTWTQGEVLRKAREDARMTQSQLAEQLGMHQSTIRQLEADMRPPRRTVLLSWAMATGVSARWLGGEGWAPWDSNPQPTDYVHPLVNSIDTTLAA